MKKLLLIPAVVGVLGVAPLISQASPEDDLKAFQGYFQERFPSVPLEEFANGVYAIDKASREQWEAIEEFPPYEIAAEEGEEMFNTPFKNGKTYTSCFRNGGIGIKSDYPYYDTEKGRVETLASAINVCRTKNGEPPLKYMKGELASLVAYMAYTTRGQTVDIKIPFDQRARDAYEDGKRFFYARRGQLNMSCAHCHVDNAGNKIRADLLSPALGQLTHFPVYRSKWGSLGTVHRRFSGCNKQVRALPFKAQSPEYRNLEYFMTYMSNGLPWNGPGARK
ncbi:MAG: sulfur oxidation c-type cytochrome SoxA [Gammaproteobacteria bacterium]|nr:sulfur oxidation c-type cytochrome SoxA [Gammaproteobacteria bacterium]MCF6364080.1 sulfur oxidation c-type cytochrome SoxA [Gammaproteobacteria bacterium]